MYPLQLHPIETLSAMTIHTIAAAVALALCLVAAAATAAAGAGGHPPAPAPAPPHDIASCLLSNGINNFSLPSSPSYTPLLDASFRYLRFEAPTVGKPAAIVLPASQRELQSSVLCARTASLAIRVRSGGHSYEGLSYTTENHVPFAVVDLSGLSRIRVDAASATAWAEAGATLGQLYHAVGNASRTLAFPGGTCSTLGLGGYISGGGFGLLARKHGLAADNVLDATLIDAAGRALDRSSMGADVFWALRGGGGGSFGVVYSWKLRLVPVPEKITVFYPDRRGPADHVAGLLRKWQQISTELPDEFYISTRIFFTNGGNLTMSFTGQVLAPKQQALSALNAAFPELGLAESELAEVSWVEAAAKFADLGSVADLTSRQPGVGEYAKRKSDYILDQLGEHDAAAIARYLTTAPTEGSVQLNPYGGAMGRIGTEETPFPHRLRSGGSVQYAVEWTAAEDGRAGEFMGWLRELYAFMAPFVSKNPRQAYVNYVDLDLGTNNWTAVDGGGALSGADAVKHAAAAWGASYFVSNFDRLVRAKTEIDPGNVFNNAQSIPPLR